MEVVGRAFEGLTVGMLRRHQENERNLILDNFINRLQCDDHDAESLRVYGLLIDFLTRHRDNEPLLCRFLQYATGATSATGGRIRVEVDPNSIAIRHSTCFGTITLPLVENDEASVAAFVAQLEAELDISQMLSFNDV